MVSGPSWMERAVRRPGAPRRAVARARPATAMVRLLRWACWTSLLRVFWSTQTGWAGMGRVCVRTMDSVGIS
jgi:hypothetical protein